MVPWLEKLEPSGLRVWLRNTYVPMLSSMPDGTILWANPAYERLTGYTLPELEKLTWIELTEDIEDRKADVEMALELEAGERYQYQFRKRYKHKTGQGPQVVIDVLRYPMTGDFQCFFVSVLPLDEGYDRAFKEVEQVRELLVDFIKLQSKSTPFEKVSRWAEQHPKTAWFIGLVLFVFLFGDRALEIIKAILTVFNPMNPQP